MPVLSPSVSVIVPVTAPIDHLAETLASVDAQSHRPLEIVLVADGEPPDLSAAIAATTVPVRVVHRERGGPGAARNTGVDEARGTILAFLDSDDVWLPEKLALQVDALDRDPDLDFVFVGIEQFFSPELNRMDTPVTDARAARLGRLPSSLVVRKRSFARVGPFVEGAVFGDFLDWYSRARDLGLRETTIDRTMVRRRIHGSNTGVTLRGRRSDYVHALKAIIDRRRAEGGA